MILGDEPLISEVVLSYYGLLKTGPGAGHILDRLDIQVNDQVWEHRSMNLAGL
jgi:hypothetical protein